MLRFKLWGTENAMIQDEEGEFILYSDHKKAIQEVEAEKQKIMDLVQLHRE